MKKKIYKYPAFMVSASKEDLAITKELREKYHINVSAYIREQLRKLLENLKQLKNDNK